MKKTPFLVSTSIVALLVGSVFSGPAHATTKDSSMSTEEAVERLVELNPGTTEEEMSAGLREYAEENGQSYEQVVDDALQAAEEEEAQWQKDKAEYEFDRETRAAKAVGKLPRVDVGGDIFYNPASTVGIQHGHVGIYAVNDYIVEAPGIGKLSHRVHHSTVKVYKTSQLLYVKITETRRRSAGKYARDKLQKKPYRKNFAVNKDPYADRMNCSQLVWAAYKNSVKVDLDGNGGPGVYPKDIVKSTKTKTWRTY
ncbi:hypothetical protein HMPREF0183_1716 [Brevibacterium mcbrellneri ATCC 49030]|uniref:Uncharacterized protein n=1 Tax=Brevibacterium mcbrellneri ATCC 49030 TaxID=585530 RepID=D4YP56_9MICO|nr:hypothetical protein [Brevibacterium mcbrellneri]EFG47013.1 hypothetical protein HMPREF0183_1716 [Brevibacterium mcbrellneri ATCC 49030]